jgi:hypothetical protein
VSLGLDLIHIESGVDTPVSKIVGIDVDVPFEDARGSRGSGGGGSKRYEGGRSVGDGRYIGFTSVG